MEVISGGYLPSRDNIHHKKLILIHKFQQRFQYFPTRKQQAAQKVTWYIRWSKEGKILYIVKESYALLKQSENHCFLYVRQVLFLNLYEFYFLLLSPKLTLKLKLQLWKVPPGTKPRARFCEPSWMDSKTNWFPPPEVLGIAAGSWLEGAGGITTAEWVTTTALFWFPARSKNSPSLFDIVLNCSNVGVSQ